MQQLTPTATDPAPEARLAGRDDRDAVINNVAAAFASDPPWLFLLGEQYEQLAPLFAGALFDQRVENGTVWVTRDGAAVAMWDRPHTRHDPSRAEQSWREFDTIATVPTRSRLASYNDAIRRASPQQPFWYLGVLATHPIHQRQGLAGAVLTPALRQAGAHRLACCLETSTEANRRFYERRGFQVDQEITLARGPQTWWMRRPADAGRAHPPR